MAIEPLEKAMMLAQGMEKRRALDVMVLDMRDLMSICDFFVICHGRSQVHVEAIAQSVEDHMEENGIRPDHREGKRGIKWTILDYGSTVGHVFTEEARDYYDLERLWEDAKVVEHATEETAGTEADDEVEADEVDEETAGTAGTEGAEDDEEDGEAQDD